MHKVYSSRSVCECVYVCVLACVSVTTLAAIHLVYMLKTRCH